MAYSAGKSIEDECLRMDRLPGDYHAFLFDRRHFANPNRSFFRSILLCVFHYRKEDFILERIVPMLKVENVQSYN
jgi:hypothetical protein